MSQTARKNTQANDDDMRPEYDFSRGLRGVHAYRFSKLSSDEALVLSYWQGKGFELGSFAKNEMRDLKTPDFRLSRGGVEVALCEVKSFQRDEWLEDQLKQAAPGVLVGGLRPDPVFNRISNAVHTGFQQFESVNPAHRLLNFLCLVNHDTSARPEDLDRVLSGFEDPLHGCLDSTCVQFSEGRIREEKKRIDLYVWMDFLKPDKIHLRRFFFGNLETRESVCSLLGVDPAKVKNIPPAA
ncbi:MAG: hypothetical protein P4K93_13080 [Terracidiphilus sp.]|nr:hypothetical protein [Terracidiphilus sp.]MDR3799084.1 hypothetical protein [Terracidiphilus sp.]